MRRQKSTVGISEPSEPSTPALPPQSSGSALQRRGSAKQLGKKKSSSSLSQRLEIARRRTDAALMIQRTWHRWYVSAARRKRGEAAKAIQHAWAGTFYIANARRELQFLRWLRERREKLRGQWQRLLAKLEQRRLWALVTIAAAKNVWIWRRRILRRRNSRFAVRLQRWWRQCKYNRKTRSAVLFALELKELLRLEHVMRVSMCKQFRTSVVHLHFAGQSVLDEGHARTLKRWHSDRRLSYQPHPHMEAALRRYEERQLCEEVERRKYSARPSSVTSTPEVPPPSDVAATLQSDSNCWAIASASLVESGRATDAVPSFRPPPVPSRPSSSRAAQGGCGHRRFMITVRPPSATVRNVRASHFGRQKMSGAHLATNEGVLL